MSTSKNATLISNGAVVNGSAARGMSYPQGSVVNQTFVPSGTLGAVVADAVIEERHIDEMEITRHPVEQGSTISDHAYKLPATLDLLYDWATASNQNVANDPAFLSTMYARLLALQASATLFTVVTGKRTYTNMMIRSLAETTDKDTENILALHMSLQEILMAVTSSLTVSAMSQQALPSKTSPIIPTGTVGLQPGTNYNASGQ